METRTIVENGDISLQTQGFAANVPEKGHGEDGKIPGSRVSFYKKAFENASQGILVVRGDGAVVSCNAAFAALFRLPPDFPAGLKLGDLMSFAGKEVAASAAIPFPASLDEENGARLAFDAANGAFSGFLRCFPAGEGHVICFVEETTSRQSQKDFLQFLVRLSIEPDMPPEKMLRAALQSFCENFGFVRAAIIELEGEGAPVPFSAYPQEAGQGMAAEWQEVHVSRKAQLPDSVALGDTPLGKYRTGKWIYFPLFLSRLRWGYLVLEGRSVAGVSQVMAQETFFRSILMWLSGRLSEFAARRNLMALNEEMQLREKLFRTLYRSTPAMMHSINDEGNLLEVSDKWLETLGYTREEVIGRKSFEFLAPISHEYATRKVYPDFMRNGYIYNVPYTLMSKDRTAIEVELSAIRCLAADGSMQSLAVMVDVTERNCAFKEIEEKRESLKKANDSLRKFTHIASHDFQEPLRKMQQFSYLLRQECEDVLSSDAQEYLHVIATSAQRMSALIGDLLLYSRITNSLPELARVDLAEVIEAALESEQRHLGFDLPLELRQDILPAIFADRLQVQRLVRAILSNAVKFRAPQRPLRLAITFDHAPSGAAYNLRFSDNGIGFDSRYEEKLFEPLQKLHGGQSYPGTGMGLAIARAICDNHRWKIAGEGRLGEGADFTVTLPLGALVEGG